MAANVRSPQMPMSEVSGVVMEGSGTAQVVQGAAPATKKQAVERRTENRYELNLECDLYWLRSGGPVWAASGKTTVWSRNSVAIQTQLPLTVGNAIQIDVRWMFGLRLIAMGVVVRTASGLAIFELHNPRFQGEAANFWNQEVSKLQHQEVDLTPRA